MAAHPVIFESTAFAALTAGCEKAAGDHPNSAM
jgi:hypothetical protein